MIHCKISHQIYNISLYCPDENTLSETIYFTTFDQNIFVIIFINNKEINIFKGARVCDAVLAYSKSYYNMLIKETLRVMDQHGNIIAEDAPLEEGQAISIKKK
jgi:hypothetical protein